MLIFESRAQTVPSTVGVPGTMVPQAGFPRRAHGKRLGLGGRLLSVVRYEMHWDSRKFWLYGSIGLLLLLFVVSWVAALPTLGGAPGGLAPGSTTASENYLRWLRSSWWEDGTFLLMSYPPGFVAFVVGEASASGTVARERDKGTLGALLAQPLSRAEIFFGKYFAKLLVFLAFSVAIVLGMIVISTVALGSQLYLIWAPIVVFDLTMIFAFYAAYAQFLSCFLRRSRSVFFVMVLTWFMLFGLMEYAAIQGVKLLPYAYFVPINSATLALACIFRQPERLRRSIPSPGSDIDWDIPAHSLQPLLLWHRQYFPVCPDGHLGARAGDDPVPRAWLVGLPTNPDKGVREAVRSS